MHILLLYLLGLPTLLRTHNDRVLRNCVYIENSYGSDDDVIPSMELKKGEVGKKTSLHSNGNAVFVLCLLGFSVLIWNKYPFLLSLYRLNTLRNCLLHRHSGNFFDPFLL